MAFTPLYPTAQPQTGTKPGFTPLGQQPVTPQQPTNPPDQFNPFPVEGTPVAPIGEQTNARADQVGKILNNSTPAGKTNILEKGAAIFGQGAGLASDIAGDAVGAGLHVANQALGGVPGMLADKGVQAAIKTPLGAMGINAVHQGVDAWEKFVDAHPRAAQDLSALAPIANLVATFYTGGEAGAAIKTASEAASPIVKGAITATTDAAKGQLAERATARSLQNTIEAVNPELKGTAKIDAYKDVVSGGKQTAREATPGSILKQQKLSIAPRDEQIGKRLHEAGISLGTNPVKNLNTLSTALRDTEAKLETVLKTSKSEFGADKIPLINKIDKLVTKMPEEFKAIKDNGKVFSSVINFGKKIVLKAKDDINGLRNARQAFDAQAKLEFPSAFTDGGIDLKTPAGRAIKAMRDTINDHLYTTAPEGSEIQKLIGTEADIYRARDAIAPRAAAGHGKSLPEQLLDKAKKHPIITGIAAYEGAKTLGL